MASPLYSTNPNFIERHYGVVSLSVSNRQLDKNTKTVRFVGAKTLTVDPIVQSTLFTVPVSGTYRSKSLRRNKMNRVEENTTGLTTASFDPDDFAGTNFHGEGAINFVKIEELNAAGTEIKESPWLVVPPPDFFASGRRTLFLNGLCPEVPTPSTPGLPPPGCLVIKMPKYADAVTIENPASGNHPLFISLGAGHLEYEIESGASLSIGEAGLSVLFVRSPDGKVPFKATLAIVNGIEA